MKYSLKKLLHKFFYDIKIHEKIIIFTIILSSIPIIMMSYVFYSKSEQIINTEVSSSYKQILNQYIDNVKYKMNLYSFLLVNVTYSSVIQDTTLSNSDKDYSAYMDIINKVSTEVESLVFDKNQGGAYNITIYPVDNSVTYYQPHIGNIDSIKNNDWFNKIDSKQIASYVGIGNTGSSNVNIITLIRTIPNLKFQSYINYLGIVKLDINSDLVFSTEKDMTDGKNKYMYILDNKNNIIYSSDSSIKINEKISNFDIDKDLNSGEKLITLGGKKGIFVYENIEPYGWKAVLFHDNSQIEKKLTSARLSILITDMVICVIIILLALIFANSFSKRFKMLSNKMERVSNGDLEINYKIIGNDELGLLDDYFNSMVYKLDEMINENYVQKLEKKEAQLNALQAQLNPHFLYNTLEVINSIASVYGCIEICNISQKLGEMFRYNINSGKNEFVMMKDEILHIKNYEYILKTRFDNKIKISYDIPEIYYNSNVLKFILQPFVENCIIHGFKGDKESINIYITALMENRTFIINVIDDGVGITKEKLKYLNIYINEKDDNINKIREKSIGMKNVNSRLKLCYGDQYGIIIESSDGKGTKVSLRMPADQN